MSSLRTHYQDGTPVYPDMVDPPHAEDLEPGSKVWVIQFSTLRGYDDERVWRTLRHPFSRHAGDKLVILDALAARERLEDLVHQGFKQPLRVIPLTANEARYIS